MKHLLCIFLLMALLSFAGAGEESTPIEPLNLYHNLLRLPQTTDLDLAVSVNDNKTIIEISSSIMKAETWLKTHVLSRYPSTKITTIVVFFPDSCQTETLHKPSVDLVMSSLKNIYHSLTRWGLEKDIKVSSGFSYKCLKSSEMLKPVLVFLKTMNSTFTINPPENFLSSPDNHLDLLYSVKKLGFLSFNKVNFLNTEPEEEMRRRNLRSLTNIRSQMTNSFSTLPFPEPPQSSISSPPEYPPQGMISRPPPPSPCLPSHSEVEGVWCVAKPSVPAEILQQSLDFACGKGGANCDAIKPHGICFYPDTTMAHASYAFNTYWQLTKRNGGTCSFGGTAMLITADPSYQHCRFLLN